MLYPKLFVTLPEMHLPEESTRILDVYKALRKSSFWVIVVRKCMGHAWVPLKCNIVPSLLHKTTIKLPFISLKIKFCCDDVCPRKVFE